MVKRARIGDEITVQHCAGNTALALTAMLSQVNYATSAPKKKQQQGDVLKQLKAEYPKSEKNRII